MTCHSIEVEAVKRKNNLQADTLTGGSARGGLAGHEMARVEQ